ncbi:MAG: hypothetical protein ACHREM_05610 [Polyangiales bacterium]
MRVYVASDFHIQDADQPWLFTPTKVAAFCAVAKEALDRGGALLLAGDIFDLTGMQPPALGLADFFARAAPGVTIPLPSTRILNERLRAAIDRFPDFRDALKPLAASNRLWLMPGNHDCGIDGQLARIVVANAIGVSPDVLRFEETYRVGDVLLAAHGHEFDPANSTSDGCSNAGSIITACLYHAVMPALRALGVSANVTAAIPCVRPEENLVNGIQAYLGGRTQEFLLAFVNLLQDNGYFHGVADVRVWLATHILSGLVSVDRVREALRDDTDVAAKARAAAGRVLDGLAFVPTGQSPPKVVVLGHTHELDATPNYVNLGTWIDHVRGLGPTDLVAVDRTLPVLVIDGDAVSLHDVASIAASGSVTTCHRLWQRGEDRISR